MNDILQLFSPKQIIEQKTANEIEVYLSARDKSSIHQSTRNLSENVSDDYGNRFLVELIQNAHDAHPSGNQNGQIALVFASDEGEFGCLYVANRGNGFSEKNFRALTNIALSSKSVNESIGNKGLGFRSVLQICQWPEVYSKNASISGGGFDGFCFRFANSSDLISLINGPNVPELAEEILQKMPCWYLPVYVADRPGLVTRFAEEKYASVVRLPLDSDKARHLVLEQFDALVDGEHPLHLFLDRVSSIHLERDPGRVVILKREVKNQWKIGPDLLVERVAIGANDYLIALHDLNEDDFQKTLDSSIERKDIPESWGNWQGKAQVSVAVPLNASVESGLMYCFLPLGNEGKAPFAGYINANFYTKMDRRAVNEGIILNKYFLDTAAWLSCSLIEFLIAKNWPEATSAVVDLMCWDFPYSQIVKTTLGKQIGGICERPLLPTRHLSGSIHWSPPDKTIIWDAPKDSCFSSTTITRLTDAPLLIDSLDEKQLNKLRRFFLSESLDFTPSTETLALWAEQIAADLLKRDVSLQQWGDFYDEIAQYFKVDASSLLGKKFLLSVNGDLIASEFKEISGRRRRTADVYFPPVMVGDSESNDLEGSLLPLDELPVELQKGFALINRGIPWSTEKGGHRPGRLFLMSEKLVREYDTAEVIRTLAEITQSDTAEKIKEQALRWAFRFWSSGREIVEKDTRATRLFVPTRGGWRPAESSMFGAGWASSTNGRRLESFVKSASSFSSELAEQFDCFLPPYAAWIAKTGGEEYWARFLRAAGVRDHLQPVSGDKVVCDGTPSSLANTLSQSVRELSEDSKRMWYQALQRRANKTQFSTRTYRSDLTPWRMPGLNQVDQLTNDQRKEFAIQLIQAISDLHDNQLKFRVYRPGNPSSGPVPEFWPTPLWALLEEVCWLPVTRGNDGIRFVRPADAWYFDAEDEAPPRFMELIPPTISKVIDEAMSKRLRQLVGLRTLNDSRDAIHALSAYCNVARVGLTEVRDVRRFRELFERTWSHVAPRNEGIEVEALPVLIGERIEAFEFDDDSADHITRLGYFIDTADIAKQQLVAELELPAFVFGQSLTEDTWGWLEALAPNRFLRLSSERLDVVVDGIEFNSSVCPPLLTEIFGPWIADFIVCVAEHKGGAFFTATQSVLAKIRHSALNLRVYTGTRVQISMSGAVRELPSTVHNAVVIWPPDATVLIVQTQDEYLDLKTLSVLAGQLSIALNYPVLSSALEAALFRLSTKVFDNEIGYPDDDDVAEVLGISKDKLEQTRLYIRSDLSGHLPWARLLAAVLGETEALEHLLAVSEDEPPPEDVIHSSLLPVADSLEMNVQLLLNRLAAVSSPMELIREFELDISEVNTAIRTHFPHMKPLSYEELHRRQFKAYITNNSVEYTEMLRAAYLSKFEASESLEEYVRLRDGLLDIEPPVDWFETYNDLPEEQMDAYIRARLKDAEVSVDIEGTYLPSLTECRQTNGKRLRDFWLKFSNVLAAWVRYGEEPVTATLQSAWSNSGSKVDEYLALARKGGWFDFRLLDEPAIQKYLIEYGIWPSNKPLSTELSAWGISEDEMRKSAAHIEEARESARQKRLKLNLNGSELLATEDNYIKLISAVTEHFDACSGLTNLGAAIKKLANIEVSRTNSRPGGGSGSTGNKREPRSPDTGLSDEQRQAVGLVGELYAKEWIRRFYRQKHGMDLPDTCWVSEYCNTTLNTDHGNDQLGYDLVVHLKSVTHYYEVKASIGDSGVFELGPTEIAAAHRYRADKDHRYRLIYVSNATDFKRMKITILPNPFSKEGVRSLRAIGRGSVTFKFEYEE